MNNIKTDYCKILRKNMQLKNYSELTIRSYESVVFNFLQWIDVPPTKVGLNHFKQYILDKKFNSISSQNRYVSALKYFYYKVLNKKNKLPEFDRPRKERKLPRVIDKDLLRHSIMSIQNNKHKAILAIAFTCALRVSEVVNLKIKDIDSVRMLILIQRSKGNKDRYVPISDNLIGILREYYNQYKPQTYLFNGTNTARYSASSCNKLVKKYIGSNYSFHHLRHSGATAILENGADIRVIQSILGHSSSKTTEIYTHVSTGHLNNVCLPI